MDHVASHMRLLALSALPRGFLDGEDQQGDLEKSMRAANSPPKVPADAGSGLINVTHPITNIAAYLHADEEKVISSPNTCEAAGEDQTLLEMNVQSSGHDSDRVHSKSLSKTEMGGSKVLSRAPHLARDGKTWNFRPPPVADRKLGTIREDLLLLKKTVIAYEIRLTTMGARCEDTELLRNKLEEIRHQITAKQLQENAKVAEMNCE